MHIRVKEVERNSGTLTAPVIGVQPMACKELQNCVFDHKWPKEQFLQCLYMLYALNQKPWVQPLPTPAQAIAERKISPGCLSSTAALGAGENPRMSCLLFTSYHKQQSQIASVHFSSDTTSLIMVAACALLGQCQSFQ